VKARDDANDANRFLRDLFMSFGNVAGARERLAVAEKKLDDGWLKDQPQTHIACRIALGYYLFYGYSDSPAAERQFALALDMIRRPDGSLPPTASAPIRAALGGIFVRRNNFEKAELYLNQAMEDYRKVPEAREELVEVLDQLAKLHDAREDAAGAARLRLEAQAVTALARSNNIAAHPDDAAPYYDRAVANLRLGRFQDGLADLVKSCDLDPGDHWSWYLRSCVYLYLGDEAAYRATAKEMIERFGADPRRERRERAAKACLLSPNPVVELERLTMIADGAVAPGAAANLMPWFRLCKGLADYRAGHYESALDSLQRAQALDSSYGKATVELLFAMTQQRMGHAAKAREWLDQATRRLDEQLPRAGKDDLGGSPENYLIACILRREAEALVKGQ
jgi:tetratricopeptide (TPR) repeat protein